MSWEDLESSVFSLALSADHLTFQKLPLAPVGALKAGCKRAPRAAGTLSDGQLCPGETGAPVPYLLGGDCHPYPTLQCHYADMKMLLKCFEK